MFHAIVTRDSLLIDEDDAIQLAAVGIGLAANSAFKDDGDSADASNPDNLIVKAAADGRGIAIWHDSTSGGGQLNYWQTNTGSEKVRIGAIQVANANSMTDGSESGDMIFYTKDTGDSAAQARVYLRATGNMSIGTTGIGYRLWVSASAASDYVSALVNTASGSCGVLILQTSNSNTSGSAFITFFTSTGAQGSIDHDGAGTVRYNGFRATHYAIPAPDAILTKGHLVSLTGNRFRHNQNHEHGEPVYEVVETSTYNDPTVGGVWAGLGRDRLWAEGDPLMPPDDPDDDGIDRDVDGRETHRLRRKLKAAPWTGPYVCNMDALGNTWLWVTEEGGNLRKGDFLISASTPGEATRAEYLTANDRYGTATPYPASHNNVVARITQAVDWSRVIMPSPKRLLVPVFLRGY